MKVLSISDDPRIKTGYSHISTTLYRYLRDQGHEVVAMAGSAMMRPFRAEEWEGITLWPVKDFGNMEQIRYLVRKEKPDVLFLNADPRFFQTTAFQIDNEIRKHCPIAFYHIWDAPPFPVFNIPMYKCCDTIIAATKFTYDLLINSGHDLPNVDFVPIGVDTSLYKPLPPGDFEMLGREIKEVGKVDFNFVAGFVGRTIPRKRIQDLMRIFTKFAEGKNDVLLVMHTSLNDVGGNPGYVLQHLFPNSPIVISTAANTPDDVIVKLYNLFDVSINISSAEGFGMPLVESLLCGTPVIAPNIAGPSGFVTNENGWLLEPDINVLSCSNVVPFCTDFYVSDENVLNALEDAYTNRKKLAEKAAKCRSTIVDTHNVQNMVKLITESLQETVNNFVPQPSYTLTQFPKRSVDE